MHPMPPDSAHDRSLRLTLWLVADHTTYLPTRPPEVGELVEVRSRRWLVEAVETPPELVLSRLLDEYRSVRETRFEDVPARTRAAAGLLVVGLQQKLLSSIEAFAISLARHRKTAREQWERFASGDGQPAASGSDAFVCKAASLFAMPPDADDDRAEHTDEENESEEAAQITAVNADAESASAKRPNAEALWHAEQDLLDRMETVASAARGRPDAKTRELIRWINDHLCPDRPRWNDRRVLLHLLPAS